MDAVEPTHRGKLALASLHCASVIRRPYGELAALVAVFVGASLQTQLILI